ncbi:MAG: 7-cyano-7-deazaguanine synthase [Candidatus Peregrinibacteria bacterium]
METSLQHERGVLLLSGGLDSAVVLAMAQRECRDLYCLFFAYNQKTLSKERDCTRALAEHFHAKLLQEVDIGFLGEMTHAALCTEASVVSGGNEYVPFRNAIFLSIATALAESVRAKVIYIGSTGGDRICRDNSPEFREDFEKVIMSGTNAGERIEVAAPLADVDKVGVVQRGIQFGAPFELTWSCHNNTDTPCGKCSNCIAREKAFSIVGIGDPILK